MQQKRNCWKQCFLLGPYKGIIRKTIEAGMGSWKGAAVHGGLEHGSRGIAIVRSRYQETYSEDTAGWENT
jgi:hypothetical protein